MDTVFFHVFNPLSCLLVVFFQNTDCKFFRILISKKNLSVRGKDFAHPSNSYYCRYVTIRPAEHTYSELPF